MIQTIIATAFITIVIGLISFVLFWLFREADDEIRMDVYGKKLNTPFDGWVRYKPGKSPDIGRGNEDYSVYVICTDCEHYVWIDRYDYHNECWCRLEEPKYWAYLSLPKVKKH